MKKFAVLILLFISSFILMSCKTSDSYDIVTSMYTHYDFASQIVGDKMSVNLLIPLGADIHSFEASSKNIVDIKDSKLFLFTSLDIDTWIKDPKKIGGKDTVVLDMSKSYVLEEHHHLSLNQAMKTVLVEDEHDHDNEELHYWVDPMIALQMIEYILEHIVLIDPLNEAYYRQNALSYITEIDQLHHQIDETLTNPLYMDSTIYFAGHNALGLFAERYHLNIVSLFGEFKPDADLTSSEIIAFSDLVKSSQTHFLFTEVLIQPKAALVIKENLKSKNQYDLTLLELHTYHNLNQKDWEAKVTYKDLLQRNFEQIRIALGIPQSND